VSTRGKPSNWLRSGQVRLQLTVSQSVCLGVEPHLGLMIRYLFIYVLFFFGESCSPVNFGAPSLTNGQSVICQYIHINKIFTTYQIIGWSEISDYTSSRKEMEEWASDHIGSP
jgi:hypothetical protein